MGEVQVREIAITEYPALEDFLYNVTEPPAIEIAGGSIRDETILHIQYGRHTRQEQIQRY